MYKTKQAKNRKIKAKDKAKNKIKKETKCRNTITKNKRHIIIKKTTTHNNDKIKQKNVNKI